MGRDDKLTPEAQRVICAIMAEVADMRIAARAAKVGYSTLKSWKAKGRKQKSGKYRKFVDALEEATDKCEYRLRKNVWTSNDWRASAWALKHMNPRKYSDSTRLEHTGAKGGPVRVDTRSADEMTDEELIAIAKGAK